MHHVTRLRASRRMRIETAEIESHTIRTLAKNSGLVEFSWSWDSSVDFTVKSVLYLLHKPMSRSIQTQILSPHLNLA